LDQFYHRFGHTLMTPRYRGKFYHRFGCTGPFFARMPRPRVSPENKALALDFACVVTTDHATDSTSFVARHGPNSIYAALARCCPGVARDHSSSSANRKGISEAEFLRALHEQARPLHNREFVRFRDRKAVKMSEDPAGAGMCLFRNVRWRNPGDAADLKYLHEQHKRMSRQYPAIAGTSVDCWASTLASVIAVWEGSRSSWAPDMPTACSESRARQGGDDSAASTSCGSPPAASPPSPPHEPAALLPRWCGHDAQLGAGDANELLHHRLRNLFAEQRTDATLHHHTVHQRDAELRCLVQRALGDAEVLRLLDAVPCKRGRDEWEHNDASSSGQAKVRKSRPVTLAPTSEACLSASRASGVDRHETAGLCYASAAASCATILDPSRTSAHGQSLDASKGPMPFAVEEYSKEEYEIVKFLAGQPFAGRV
jgi:hypothetical protein